MNIKLVGVQGSRHRLEQGIFHIADLQGVQEGTLVTTNWLGSVQTYRISGIETVGELAIAWLD